MLILASQSPRRREMFERLQLRYTAVSTDTDETVTETLLPDEYVRTLALRKAEEAAGQFSEDCLIIAADTVVALHNDIFGKPTDKAHAKSMIAALSGKTHQVYTAFAIKKGSTTYAEAVATNVTFRHLSAQEIEYYVEKENPLDKAGAYAIQEMAGIFVEKIEGNFDNVVGLPLCQLELALRRVLNLSLFDYAK